LYEWRRPFMGEIIMNGISITSSNVISHVRKHSESEIDIIATETYGFNPGQNIDIKTDLKIEMPKDKQLVVTTIKPLLLIGSPFFQNGKLTLKMHNSMVGKNGAYIVSPGELLCRLTVVSK
jgi:hypothetical protein